MCYDIVYCDREVQPFTGNFGLRRPPLIGLRRIKNSRQELVTNFVKLVKSIDFTDLQ